jgi:hypothetical protein
MNIGGLVSALLPVFFLLALGYFARKRIALDSDQAAGLSKLALSFALPASLFVSTTDMPKDLLLQQGRLRRESCRTQHLDWPLSTSTPETGAASLSYVDSCRIAILSKDAN